MAQKTNPRSWYGAGGLVFAMLAFVGLGCAKAGLWSLLLWLRWMTDASSVWISVWQEIAFLLLHHIYLA
jgi:hypothetical protein